MIVSNAAYLRDVGVPQLVFMPAIDPFTIKNKEMTEAEVDERLHARHSTDRPTSPDLAAGQWKDLEKLGPSVMRRPTPPSCWGTTTT